MNETFYALVENGVVTNVMVLYPPSEADIERGHPHAESPDQGHQRPKRFCGGLYRRNGDGGVRR